MAISNSTILIRRSSTTGKPASLSTGELAYSFSSNTLFIGDGTAVLNVGGVYYTQTLDSATSANTADTLVKRAANGSFSGHLTGTADQLTTSQNFSISGGDITATAVSFDGLAPVTLNASLDVVPGLVAGQYGSSSTVPVVTIGANGRVLAVTTAAVASGGSGTGDFVISDGTTSNTIYYANGAIFYLEGTNGITSTVTGNTVTFRTDTTVVRSNTSLANQTINSDLTVTGNLVILGSNTTINTVGTTIQSGDTLIELGANNTITDLLDIGFYGKANTGTITYSGLIREGTARPSNGYWYLFNELATQPTGNNINYSTVAIGTLVANLTGGMIHALANTIGVVDGGTGTGTFASGEIVIGNGTGPLLSLANSGAISVTANPNTTINTVTVDTYGRVTGFTTQAISGLTVGQGGTGLSTVTLNGIVFGNGTGNLGVTAEAGISDQTWTNQILTVNNSGIPVWASALDGGTF